MPTNQPNEYIEKPAHHRPNGRFQNPSGSPPHIAGISDFVKFLFRYLRAQSKRIRPPKNHVLSSQQAKQMFERHKRHSALTWLGHASFLLRVGGKTILTDPFLSHCAGPTSLLGAKRFVPAAFSVKSLPKVDILLLSHNHYDHCDLETLRALPNKKNIEVVVPLHLASLLKRCEFRRVYELDWYDSITLFNIELTALPAIHFSGRGLFDRNKTLWASFSIRTKQHHIYFSGDTAYGKVFEEIGVKMGPFDVAIIGMGAYEPRRIMRPYHAAPEEAVQIGLAIRASRLVGMHWGTVLLSTEDPFEAPKRFKKAGTDAGIPEDNLWALQIGETRRL